MSESIMSPADNAAGASPTSSSASSESADVANSANTDFSCDHCSKEFARVDSLRRHVKRFHGEDALQLLIDKLAQSRSGKGLLACDMCAEHPKNFLTMCDLIQHHVKAHGFKEEVESLVFNTMQGK